MGFLTHKTEVPDDLREHGVRGKATIEKADMAMGVTEYEGYMSQKKVESLLTGERSITKYKLHMHVDVPGREPYDVKVTLPVPAMKARYMSGGSVVEVLVDPKKADHLAIDWDGQFQQGTIDQMAAANPYVAAAMKGAGMDVNAIAQMQRNAMAAGQTPSNVFINGQMVGATPVAAKPDPLDEIKKLADLRDAGILTDEEFATQKAKLLNG